MSQVRSHSPRGRVVVAMSGGVDSTVAALLLVRQGFETVGVTLQLAELTEVGFGASRCCSAAGVEAAQRAARRLGIPHVLLDVRAEFFEHVLDPFVNAYLRGETPSPCVHCNAAIKFGRLLDVAHAMGAERVATGHYARVLQGVDGEAQLHRASESARDQSYFLFEIGRQRLRSVLLPLGALRKDEVRSIARAEGLPSASLPDSQDICFVPEGESYSGLLQHQAGGRLPGPGDIVGRDGRLLGRHQGIHHYTVGQRRGLGISSPSRLFVTGLDPATNRVIVGDRAELLRQRIMVRDAVWYVEPGEAPRRVEVQIRSRHRASQATVTVCHAGAEIVFDEPVAAPSPGQAAVWYEGGRVLGGGWITAP